MLSFVDVVVVVVVVVAVEPSTAFACSPGTTKGEAELCCFVYTQCTVKFVVLWHTCRESKEANVLIRGKCIDKTGSGRFNAARDETELSLS